MATLHRRRNRDGSTSWDATVRRVGYPTMCRSFRTRLEADLWAARTEAAAQGRTLTLAKGTTLAQMLELALPRLRNPVPAAFAYWREALGDRALVDVTSAQIAHHRDLLLGAPCSGYRNRRVRPRSSQSVRNYLVELGRAYQVAIRELHLVDANPVARVKKPPASRWRVRFLGVDEQARLLEACKHSDSSDLYPFVLFCLTTGCRKGEAAALTWQHVDLARRWAVFPITKNGTARGVPLTQAVVELLHRRRHDDPRVFPREVTKAWHGAIARAGIVDFKFHDLRHTAASRLVMAGASLVETAGVLGHKTPAMVMRYAHLAATHTTELVDRVMGGVA